jgi:hypothetical protein
MLVKKGVFPAQIPRWDSGGGDIPNEGGDIPNDDRNFSRKRGEIS